MRWNKKAWKADNQLRCLSPANNSNNFLHLPHGTPTPHPHYPPPLYSYLYPSPFVTHPSLLTCFCPLNPVFYPNREEIRSLCVTYMTARWSNVRFLTFAENEAILNFIVDTVVSTVPPCVRVCLFPFSWVFFCCNFYHVLYNFCYFLLSTTHYFKYLF